jgi:RHS repeat-associated protein
MLMPGRSYSSTAYKYGFNGKEKDDEVKGVGNSLDFGARVYDSRLGRWLSLDPLQMKYPNLNPYHFCAGNPVLYVDKDGKDYDIHINHTDKVIVVKASYLALLGDAQKTVDNILEFGKDQNGKFIYQVKSGKETITYEVKFELEQACIDADKNIVSNSTVNYVKVKPDDQIEKEAASANEKRPGGYNIRNSLNVAKKYKKDKDVAKHEAGHGLGMEHKKIENWGPNAMNETVFEIQDEDLKAVSVEETLGRGGIGRKGSLANENGKTQFGIPVKITSEGQAPDNFNNGRVKKK